MIKDFFHGILGLVYPSNCLICKDHLITHSPADILCPKCISSIKHNIPPFCVKCSRHIGNKTKYNKCNSCIHTNPYFDFAWSACLFEDPIKDLIHRFKYKDKTLLGNFFSKIIINFIKEYSLDIEQFDIIIPIPLFSSRKRERGFNQSELITNKIGKHFNMPVYNDIILRKENTKSQTLLNKKERWTNIKGAFRIRPSINIVNNNILIVDDLITTGATASEASRILKENGANIVGVLTLATAV